VPWRQGLTLAGAVDAAKLRVAQHPVDVVRDGQVVYAAPDGAAANTLVAAGDVVRVGALSRRGKLDLAQALSVHVADKVFAGGEEASIFIGPEGGWSPSEKALFKSKNLPMISFGTFTLRAETAAIIATAKVPVGETTPVTA